MNGPITVTEVSEAIKKINWESCLLGQMGYEVCIISVLSMSSYILYKA